MKNKTLILVVAVAVLLLAANIAEIALVFNMTTSQSKQSGADRLEVVGGELEDTINEASFSVMQFAVEVQPFVEDRPRCESFVRRKKDEVSADPDTGCFNAYVASEEWHYIPDFTDPDDYDVTKRSWYEGAMKKQGEPYVTDPYVDAMTGSICYTVSVMLSDNKTIVCMDYTMDNIQQHIKQMNSEGKQQAVIVTEEGIIAGCSDEKLVGKDIIQSIPDYAGIFSLVKNSEGSVSIKQRGVNLFAAHSGFGWYLIVSENNWSLYKSSYVAMIAMLVISLTIFGVMLALYLMTVRREKETQEKLEHDREFMRSISHEFKEPVDRIIHGASVENIRNSVDYEQEFLDIRESGARLSSMLSKLRSYSELVNSDKNKPKEKRSKKRRDSGLVASRHFRSRIFAALLIVTAICVYINVSDSLRYGSGQMQRAVTTYEYQLSEWINTQKSILDMFCSNISTNPEILDDYDRTVEYLDGITRQYPEISMSYFANPDMEHPVRMNNGWEPGEEFRVETRSWYKELMAADKDWIISSPYYDAQSGLYCVTFAEKIYDADTGEYLGNFGIDFFMDKLVDILGSSYSDSRYAFLVDAKGEMINHPYGKFQMSEDNSVNIIELPYNVSEPDGQQVKLIKDYDGKLKVVISTRNEDSGFGIYVVDEIWAIYKSVFIYGSICLLVLIICVVAVYKVMTGLINLQDEANLKLKESADAAIAADKAKSDFLAQMSHEIRTPINAVLGMNEMIIHESGDDRIREYAANIQSSGRTLLSLINSILDFSKIEDGKMEIIPAEYETAVLINDLVNSISPRAAAKQLDLIVKADESLPSALKGDDMRIKQVILNLLTNAVKYTEKGSVELVIRGENSDGGQLDMYVEVTDTGIGIRKEDLDDLFESFKRLEVKRNRNIEGTGLGMSIVTRLLDMMNSRLEVKSVYGEGSTFSFKIKQGIVSAEPMGDYEKRILADHENDSKGQYLYAPGAKVLVVDDNSMNLKVAENLLGLYGISADTADSGAQALEKMRGSSYDVVFLDHMMPKMDGIEVMHEILRHDLMAKGSAVIALTANAIIGARDMYISEGFSDYLTKPIESRELEKQLRRFLPEEKKQYREPEQRRRTAQPAADSDSFTAEEIFGIRDICPGLNVAAGMGNCMDSKEFWLDTLRGFIEADKSEELERAFAAGDTELYRITVHSVKSAAKTIGADMLSEHAKALEFAARDKDTAFVKAHHSELVNEYRRIMKEIERVIET